MAKIILDLRKIGGPTDKQIKLVKFITSTLEIEFPEYTFEVYSQFISKHLEDAKALRNEIELENYACYYSYYEDYGDR